MTDRAGGVSRRDFLKVAAGTGALAAAGMAANPLLGPAAVLPAKRSGPVVGREVDQPTYVRDLIPGETIQKFDPRMRGWTLASYRPGDGFYERFFEIYPELMPAYERLAPYRDPLPVKAQRGGVTPFSMMMSGDAILPCAYMNNEAFLQPKVAEKQQPADPDDMAFRIKEFGMAMGAADVKIGPLNPDWLYANQGQNLNDTWGQPVFTPHKSAISLAFSQRWEYILNGGSTGSNFEVLYVYSLMAIAAVIMAKAIADAGYGARAHTVSNYHILQVPIALDAGMGEMGRMGYIIHPELGANFRLITVTTDLPMTYDKPIDFGLQDFCTNCKLCAEACPAGAIPKGDKATPRSYATDLMHNLGGIKKWFIDPIACQAQMGVQGPGCGICHVSCPWSKPPSFVHSAARSFAVAGGGAAGSILAEAERTFYGPWQSIATPDWLK